MTEVTAGHLELGLVTAAVDPVLIKLEQYISLRRQVEDYLEENADLRDVLYLVGRFAQEDLGGHTTV